MSALPLHAPRDRTLLLPEGNWRIACLALTICLVPACHPHQLAQPLPGPVPVLETDGPILVVSHPSPGVLEDLDALIEEGFLATPGLRILAVFAFDESEAFHRASRWASRRTNGPFRVEHLPCAVGPREVFLQNGCTAAFRDLSERASGFLFPGGDDIQPSLYGQRTHLATDIRNPARHRFEVSFLAQLAGGLKESGAGNAAPPAALLAGRPDVAVLGICLGMQTLAVALGGTLHQDIPSDLYGARTIEDIEAAPADRWHRNPLKRREPDLARRHWTVHAIRISAGWPFRVPEGPISVVSAHHQAVATPGPALITLGTSLDGRVIEAVGTRAYPNVLGVQFHPEYREIRQSLRPDDPAIALATPASQAFHQSLWRWLDDRLGAAAPPPAPAETRAPGDGNAPGASPP